MVIDAKDDKESAKYQAREKDGTFTSGTEESKKHQSTTDDPEDEAKTNKYKPDKELIEGKDEKDSLDDMKRRIKRLEERSGNYRCNAFIEVVENSNGIYAVVRARLTGLGETNRKVKPNENGGFIFVNDDTDTDAKDVVVTRRFEGNLNDFIGFPVTISHPMNKVTLDNYKNHVCGTITKAFYNEEETEIWCELRLFGIDGVEAIDKGLDTTSPFFSTPIDSCLPVEGDSNSFIEVVKPEYFNHLALVSVGYWDKYSTNDNYKIKMEDTEMTDPNAKIEGKDTEGVPKIEGKDTEGVPKIEGKDTEGVPKIEGKDTEGIPKIEGKDEGKVEAKDTMIDPMVEIERSDALTKMRDAVKFSDNNLSMLKAIDSVKDTGVSVKKKFFMQNLDKVAEGGYLAAKDVALIAQDKLKDEEVASKFDAFFDKIKKEAETKASQTYQSKDGFSFVSEPFGDFFKRHTQKEVV